MNAKPVHSPTVIFICIFPFIVCQHCWKHYNNLGLYFIVLPILFYSLSPISGVCAVPRCCLTLTAEDGCSGKSNLDGMRNKCTSQSQNLLPVGCETRI